MQLSFCPRLRYLYFSLHVVVLLCAPLSAAHADVYSFVAEDGSTHFSDSPNDARYQLLLRVPSQPLDAPLPAPGPGLASQAFAKEVALAAHSSQVEEALLHAVIAVESNYNPRAISAKGARGLMQLMPSTAKAYGVTDALNVQQNIAAGAQYLRQLLDRFANNKSLALAAYNAGPAAVLAHAGQIPPYAETRSYVPAVLQRYQQNLARQATATDRQ